MKKVLVIAHAFPPVGGSGVQRTSKFTKYLGEYNWDPVILTRDDRKMELRDESLLKDVPPGIRVYRTKAWDFNVLPGIMRIPGKLISRKVLIPDGERLWQVFGKKKAADIVRNEEPDIIYTTSGPYSSHLMGLYLKKAFPRIPWVADFRDEWMNNPYLLDKPHNFIRMSIERNMERKVLSTADCLIANTPVMMRNFLENNRGLKLEDKFYTISNGYDPDDFENIKAENQTNEKFTITYTGAFYGRRKPDTFLEALSRLIGDGRINREKIFVELIGHFHKDQLELKLENCGLKDVVRMSPYIKHDECIKRLSASDCLLLIEGGGRGAEAFFTGKIFEYINAGRPILANIPAKGAAAQVIHHTRTGLVSDCSDMEKTAENLLMLYNGWLEGINMYSPNREAIAKYNRKSLTGELVKVFEAAQENLSRFN